MQTFSYISTGPSGAIWADHKTVWFFGSISYRAWAPRNSQQTEFVNRIIVFISTVNTVYTVSYGIQNPSDIFHRGNHNHICEYSRSILQKKGNYFNINMTKIDVDVSDDDYIRNTKADRNDVSNVFLSPSEGKVSENRISLPILC